MITSSLVNEVSIVIFVEIFDWKIAALYVVAGLSMPEVMKRQLLVCIFGVVTVGIVVIGYLFNWIY